VARQAGLATDFEQRPTSRLDFKPFLPTTIGLTSNKGARVDLPETSQIQHIDFDLLEAIAPIRLQTEHMSIDYGAVEFPKRKLQLWLPETVSFYIDVGGHDS